MARYRRRRNPVGTLLVNAGKRGSRKTAKRSSKRAVQLASLFSRVANPRKRRRRNPLVVANPRKHRRSRRHNPRHARRSHRKSRSRRRNPLLVNRGRGRGRKGRRRNPLLVNRGRGRGKSRRRNPRRRNPLLVNRGRRSYKRRRNPGMLGGFVSKGQGYARKIPLVGGILSTMLGGLGAAMAGAIGVLPTDYALEHLGPRVPSMLRPFAYSIGGLAISAVMDLLPSFPYKDKLQTGMIFAGGAVDSFRYRRGTSMSLGDMDGDYGEDLGDAWGDDGGQFAEEYADADLQDAEYCGDDLSAEEMETAALGRAVWRRRFRAQQLKKRAAAKSKDGGEQSEAEQRGAGLPGHRWKWLIYWIGFDNFQALSQMEESKRRMFIKNSKNEAQHFVRALLSKGADSSVEEAETAGLLALG